LRSVAATRQIGLTPAESWRYRSRPARHPCRPGSDIGDLARAQTPGIGWGRSDRPTSWSRLQNRPTPEVEGGLQPQAHLEMASNRSCRAPFRFCAISGPVERVQPSTGQVLRHLGRSHPAEHLECGPSAERPIDWLRRSLADRFGTSTVPKSSCRARTPVVPASSRAPVRCRPNSVRAHFCLPDASHLG
jgi:hypothetical protein